MENAIGSLSSCSPIARKRPPGGGENDWKLPDAKRHTQDYKRDNSYQQPINTRTCNFIDSMETDPPVSIQPVSHKQDSQLSYQHIEVALLKILTEKGESDQAIEAHANILKKIFYCPNLGEIFHDIANGSLTRETVEKIIALFLAFGISGENLTFYYVRMLKDCSVHFIVEDISVLVCLSFLSFQHPSLEKLISGQNISSSEDERQQQDAEEEYVTWKVSLYLNTICADWLLYNKRGNLFGFEKEFIVSESYFKSVIERITLYEKAFTPSHYVGLFPLLLANEFWWRHTLCIEGNETTITNEISGEKLTDFVVKTLNPTWLCSILFKEDNIPGQQLLTSVNKRFSCTDFHFFNKEKALFGEEFEYIMPLPKGKGIVESNQLEEEAIRHWGENIKKAHPDAIVEKNFGRIESSVDDSNIDIGLKVTVRIGEWEVEAKPEIGTDDGRPIIEFTSSPYGMNQTFLVNGKRLSSYELLQGFVIEPAKNKGWKECSGHKHFDIFGSIGNNTELLLRLLVDIENKSWLTVLIQRAEYTKDYFPYIVQKDQSAKRCLLLRECLGHVNRQLRSATPSTGNTYVKVNQLVLWWSMLSGTERGPGNINCHASKTPDTVVDGKVSDPATTMEFRIFGPVAS